MHLNDLRPENGAIWNSLHDLGVLGGARKGIGLNDTNMIVAQFNSTTISRSK